MEQLMQLLRTLGGLGQMPVRPSWMGPNDRGMEGLAGLPQRPATTPPLSDADQGQLPDYLKSPPGVQLPPAIPHYAPAPSSARPPPPIPHYAPAPNGRPSPGGPMMPTTVMRPAQAQDPTGTLMQGRLRYAPFGGLAR